MAGHCGLNAHRRLFVYKAWAVHYSAEEFLSINRLAALVILISALLPVSILAQDTNVVSVVPLTKLDAFGTNVGTVIIRATTDMGTVSANTATLTIRCEEMTDPRAGRREYGVGIEIVTGRS